MIKRRHKRKEVAVRARIAVAAGSPPLECLVADISDGGAKIVTHHPVAIPDRFTLLLSANGAVRRKCKVAWRRGQELGLQWLS